MKARFCADLWYWRGPAPWYFVTVPEELCGELEALSQFVSYGWGMIPVTVTLGDSTWQTSLFPKDGGYVLPVKAAVRRRHGLDEGANLTLELTVDS